ncbi:MAG TPA: divergent PAP2 family protein [Candidatus Saccharibacteria bacterium]|nr:divergent PAP2 family protein [Candidatus Saccharibacteria bacterium]
MINLNLISPYIIAITAGWLISHAIKYFVSRLRGENLQSAQVYLLRSGGMPSAHTTAAFALLTVIGLIDGVSGGLFGVSLLFALIVMHDAIRVRRSSGEQGLALRKLLTDLKSNIPLPRAAQGHTPLEVLLGAVLGVTIGLVVFFATR